ncbi:2-hydroxyacid dehydrogenase [Segnochrobactraceae bacterium EtOH-i3]
MSILILTRVSAENAEMWRTLLAAAMPEEDILPVVPGGLPGDADLGAVDVAIVANPPPGLLTRCPNIRLIQSLWAGVDALLTDDTLPEQPVLARLVDPALATAMAEAVATWTLWLHRQGPAYHASELAHEWRQRLQPTAAERRVGLLGLGAMGRASAALLKTIGFDVCGWSRSPVALEGIRTFSGADGLTAMLADTEILVNLLPLTPETRGILGTPLFSALPAGAAIVNFGRGDHLVSEDLLGALERGQLSHAVLDVFSKEPLRPECPYWDHPQITVLPHVAAATDPRTAAEEVAENIRRFRAGKPLAGVVERKRGY